MNEITPSDALIIVDVQNDFLPGGTLAITAAGALIPIINRYIDCFAAAGQPIIATRDWHPAKHRSFESQGGPWPPHCLMHTAGAAFPDDLKLPDDVVVVSKGTRIDQDGYSGFDGTDLEQQLRSRNIKRLFVGGLATDFCVLGTVQDALERGFVVMLLEDAVGAVNVHALDGEKAIRRMHRLGARSMTLSNWKNA